MSTARSAAERTSAWRSISRDDRSVWSAEKNAAVRSAATMASAMRAARSATPRRGGGLRRMAQRDEADDLVTDTGRSNSDVDAANRGGVRDRRGERAITAVHIREFHAAGACARAVRKVGPAYRLNGVEPPGGAVPVSH